MKRILVIVMAVLLGATTFALAGCGSGNAATAKQYMIAADAAFTPVNQQLTTLQDASTQLITAFMSGKASTVSPEQITQTAEQMGKLLAEVDAVKAEYEKIKSLSGVKDYVTYAAAMQKAIDADKAVIAAGGNLLKLLVPAIQAGDVNALNAVVQQNMAEITKIQTMVNNAEKALQQAQQIKTSKKL